MSWIHAAEGSTATPASIGSCVSLSSRVDVAEVLEVVRGFNEHPDVHGILVQLPLPKHLDEQAILGAVSVEKDVDGFHPLNIGRLAMKGREPLFAPCTPLGCIELLDRCGVAIKGKRAVVVGRSNIVGMPAAMLLNKRDATVTICHSATKDMEAIVRQADIVIAAAGQPQLAAGYRLVGDMHFDECKTVAGAITPVPGSVGPMTIAMLLRNTADSSKRFLSGKLQAVVQPKKRGPLGKSLPRDEHLGPWSVVAGGSLVAGVVLQRTFGGRRQ
ncbi:Bifunctional protein FolD [Tetrabaena socialis]|uniref:Bifunctional protein FolD n=1 Tax=Tetrabaena socialis TaxID=47790 RepID=A0A2J8A409_9CHLO|nr:Bifunctional protein FolD [Tetrabaena socialis]|eukprot:PNH07256.1 Bifunctional protein FolD [Tetrabaena socialis]